MDLVFRASASRHGIAHERSRHVVEHCARPIVPLDPRSGEDDLVLFLGPDADGVPLEVVAVERDDGTMVVIHAMRMRRGYAAAYAEELRCR